jgi:hypothetical protein
MRSDDCFVNEAGETECLEYLADPDTGEPLEKWVYPEEDDQSPQSAVHSPQQNNLQSTVNGPLPTDRQAQQEPEEPSGT